MDDQEAPLMWGQLSKSRHPVYNPFAASPLPLSPAKERVPPLSQERIDAFLNELEALCAKHGIMPNDLGYESEPSLMRYKADHFTVWREAENCT